MVVLGLKFHKSVVFCKICENFVPQNLYVYSMCFLTTGSQWQHTEVYIHCTWSHLYCEGIVLLPSQQAILTVLRWWKGIT